MSGAGLKRIASADRACVTHLEHGTECGTGELTLAGDNQNVLDAVNLLAYLTS